MSYQSLDVRDHTKIMETVIGHQARLRRYRNLPPSALLRVLAAGETDSNTIQLLEAAAVEVDELLSSPELLDHGLAHWDEARSKLAAIVLAEGDLRVTLNRLCVTRANLSELAWRPASPSSMTGRRPSTIPSFGSRGRSPPSRLTRCLNRCLTKRPTAPRSFNWDL
jgi:hypothetical protein